MTGMFKCPVSTCPRCTRKALDLQMRYHPREWASLIAEIEDEKHASRSICAAFIRGSRRRRDESLQHEVCVDDWN